MQTTTTWGNNDNNTLTLEAIQDAIKIMKQWKPEVWLVCNYKENKKIFWHDTYFSYNENMRNNNNN